PRFAAVRSYLRAPFVGGAFADTEAEVGSEVEIDDSLAERGADGVVVVASQRALPELPPYLVAAGAPDAPAARSAPAAPAGGPGPGAAGSSRTGPSAEPPRWIADVQHLESRLRACGAELRTSRGEAQRLEGLVRDLVEELSEHQRGRRGPEPWRGLHPHPPAALLSPARPSEAHDAEAMDGLGRALAESRGRARGLAARLAEVSELRASAEARAALLTADLEASTEARRRALASLEETREELELAMIKARGAPTMLGHGAPDRVDALVPSEQRLSARVSALSGQLVAAGDLLRVAEDDRDRARAETLRLTAHLSAAETRLEGQRLGFERRIAELSAAAPSADAPSVDAPSADAPSADAPSAEAPSSETRSRKVPRAKGPDPDEAARDRARLRVELARLRGEREGLALRLRDVEAAEGLRQQRRGEAVGLASQLADAQAQLAARDGLVARLQRDLAAEEQAVRAADASQDRLRDEMARLREAVVAASGAVDAKESAERRSQVLQTELTAALARAGAVEVRAERVTELERQLAQAREGLAGAERMSGELAELRERVAEGERLLARAEEREAAGRHALAESRALLLSLREGRGAAPESGRTATGAVEPGASLASQLRTRDAALAEARARAGAVERDLDAVRDVFAETRAGLEELLGRATTRGDTAAAERLGELLEALGRR
ncbi:MAG: hypothetical protein AAF447_23085, partial [Myxococcota bacterium]